MDRSRFFSVSGLSCSFFLLGLLLYSCANKGYPEGGPKDVTPPHVIAEQPASFSKNFDKKSINIYFDEFVALKDVNEKFIISPPQAKKPKVRPRGKHVMVEFADTLRPQTTYSLDFADAIVDNNEGNPLGYYRYVFSTGDVIDTLELSGKVVDAETNEPVLNSYVFLYEDAADSVPLLQIPNYMARTDSFGLFRVTNLREANYKIIALKDENKDYKYTPEAENIGYLDTLVRPVVLSMVRTDTIGEDSIISTSYLAYGPNNLYIRLFPEKLTQLYMQDESRKQRELLTFVFSIPGQNDFKMELLDTVLSTPWYLPEPSAGMDTLHFWITDSLVYKRDTLNFKLTYLRTDSTNQHREYTDTVKLIYTDKKPQEKTKRRSGRETEKPKEVFLSMNTSVSREQDVNRDIILEFDRPIHEEGLRNIYLKEKVDTVYQPVEFKLTKDSASIRKYHLALEWKPETEYLLAVDSAMITDIYGHPMDKFEKKFKVKSLESYGRILLNMQGIEGPVVVQLYKSETKKGEDGRKIFSIVEEKRVRKDGLLEFNYLKPGKYRIRAILDANGNGQWDTGLYLKKIQPEEIIYLPAEINVRQNFDVEQEFNLQIPYTNADIKNSREK